ncbi:ATP-binding protein [Kordiimonas pumila]|uniref:histidine kinase n=1 Tax=Kordiimonas pumila TaxID=2161677 RepID=A0ABV7D1N7_9PROT|nr:ATP-binding protein [Kordiimonas pumila]
MESRLPQPIREALLDNEMRSGMRLLATALSGFIGAGGVSLIFYLIWGSTAAVLVGSFILILTSFTIFKALRNLDQPLRRRDMMDKELLNTLVEMDRRAILITSLDGGFLTSNHAFDRLSGGQIRTLYDLTGAENSDDQMAKLLQRVGQHGSAEEFFKKSVAEQKSFTLSGRRIGSYILWRIVVTNAQERLEYEKSNIQAWAAPIFEKLECGIVLEDSIGRPQYINQVLRDWLGLEGDNLPAKIITKSGNSQLLIDNKRRIDVDVIDVPLKTREADRVIGKYRFIRKLDQMRGRLIPEGREFLIDPIFDAAPVAIAVVDQDGVIIEYNQTLKRHIAGKGIAIGHAVVDIVQEQDRAVLSSLIKNTYDGQPFTHPVDIVFNGQQERVGQVYSTSIAKASNRFAILYIVDTTQEKSFERQFVQAQKMQAVGQLAGGVAHDFNNLLTAIIGFCDLLLVRHDAGDQSFSDIIQIKQNANRAANLVRQLLAFSRQQTLRPKVLMLTDILAEISNLIRRLIGENIDLRVIHGRNLAPVKVDQGQLEQVIINLAVNARDAMPDGGRLEVRTSMIGPDHALIERYDVIIPDDYLLIEVEDTGCGISTDNLNKIFEPFFTTKEVGQGTGLGLATVYGIVKQTGGFVFVESEVGKGTNFLLFLKAHASEADDKEPEPEVIAARDLTGKGTVLVVEDEDPVRMFACRALTNKGYKVLEAASGEAGLEILKNSSETIDLLISDVIMPSMDGPTLVKEARKMFPHLPVIFVSGYAEDVFRENLEAEEFLYLPKPFSLNELAEKVKSILG